MLHSISAENKLLKLDKNAPLQEYLRSWLGHRAIGVAYNQERERGNHVLTKLTSRYVSFLFIDKTRGLHPLHLKPHGDLTSKKYPFGF